MLNRASRLGVLAPQGGANSCSRGCENPSSKENKNKLECHIFVMPFALASLCSDGVTHTHTYTTEKNQPTTRLIFSPLSFGFPVRGRLSGSSFSISHGRRRPPLLRQLSYLPSLYPFLLISLPQLLVAGKSMSITFFSTYPASLLWTWPHHLSLPSLSFSPSRLTCAVPLMYLFSVLSFPAFLVPPPPSLPLVSCSSKRSQGHTSLPVAPLSCIPFF